MHAGNSIGLMAMLAVGLMLIAGCSTAVTPMQTAPAADPDGRQLAAVHQRVRLACRDVEDLRDVGQQQEPGRHRDLQSIGGADSSSLARRRGRQQSGTVSVAGPCPVHRAVRRESARRCRRPQEPGRSAHLLAISDRMAAVVIGSWGGVTAIGAATPDGGDVGGAPGRERRVEESR